MIHSWITLTILIIFSICILGILAYLLSCRCMCTCSCCRLHANHRDYQEICETEEGPEVNQIEGSLDQDTCGICLEEMKNTEDLHRVPCRHKFHRKCIGQWLHQNNRCPLCRVQLTPVNGTPRAVAMTFNFLANQLSG